jgi:molecular chaperone DnaK
VEADNIIAATEKAKANPAWEGLNPEQRETINTAIRQLQDVYHTSDYHAIQRRIEELNTATRLLAENMMNAAVQGALRGTKID